MPFKAFSHMKVVKEQKTEKPLPTPFELPHNYPKEVMDDLKLNRLSGGARAKFIASVCSAIFQYKSLPTKDEYNHVGEEIIKKYPFLKSKSGSGYVSLLRTWFLLYIYTHSTHIHTHAYIAM